MRGVPATSVTMMRPNSRIQTMLGIAICWLMACTSPAAVRKSTKDQIDFNRDIRPIFSENCYACHGPDKNKRKADLRLDMKDGIFSTHEDRHTVAPGDVEHSELYRRVTTANADERMPDPKSNKRLTDRQIA